MLVVAQAGSESMDLLQAGVDGKRVAESGRPAQGRVEACPGAVPGARRVSLGWVAQSIPMMVVGTPTPRFHESVRLLGELLA